MIDSQMNMLITLWLANDFGFLYEVRFSSLGQLMEHVLTSFMVSAYWASTYLRIALTCLSNFNSLPSWKSSPGVSVTESKTLSNLDSEISIEALWIVPVDLAQ